MTNVPPVSVPRRVLSAAAALQKAGYDVRLWWWMIYFYLHAHGGAEQGGLDVPVCSVFCVLYVPYFLLTV